MNVKKGSGLVYGTTAPSVWRDSWNKLKKHRDMRPPGWESSLEFI